MDTAKVMLDAKRYLYVGFMCHQVAEKALKGYHYHLHGEDAPYTHSLRRLIKLTGLNSTLSEDQEKFLARLERMNIEARYPKHKSDILEQLTDELCKWFVQETEGFLQWIQEKL
jgi:HEPN domain-containing protein